MNKDNSVVIARGKGVWGEMEEGTEGISGDGWKLGFGW